jgi:hypothetical protein
MARPQGKQTFTFSNVTVWKRCGAAGFMSDTNSAPIEAAVN